MLIKLFKCLFASATHAWLSSSLTIYSPSWILINASRFSLSRFTQIMTRIIANSSRSLFIKKTKFLYQSLQSRSNKKSATKLFFFFFTDFCDNFQSIEWIWQFNFLENYCRSCYSSIIPSRLMLKLSSILIPRLRAGRFAITHINGKEFFD